jgi:hypothetical protein
VVSLFVEGLMPPAVNQKIRTANAMELGGQLVTAESLPELVIFPDGTAGYRLRFRLPKGVHGGPVSLLVDGKPSANSLFLPVTLPLPFNGVTSIAASGTSLFVADADGVYQVNWLDEVPTKTLRATGRFYLSRTIRGNAVLLVSAALGKPDILELPVVGPAGPSVYASTALLASDIRAVGLAAESAGGAAYVADAVSGNILRIPENTQVAEDIAALLPVAATKIFYEPAGIDVFRNTLGFLTVGAQPGTTDNNSVSTSGQQQTLDSTDDRVLYGYLVDRVITNANPGPFLYALVSGRVGPVTVLNTGTNIVSVAQASDSRQYVELLEYDILHTGPSRPQRVLTSNQPKLGQQFPYFEAVQTADAVISVPVRGFPGPTMHYKLVDTPDTAPYIDAGVGPYYFANDNRLALGADAGFGLGETLAPCTGVTLDNNGEGVVTLTVPTQQSGDNYRIAASATTWGQNCELARGIVNISVPYTAWKRVFLEKDVMFRKGGFLSRSTQVGNEKVFLWKTPLRDGGFVRTDNVNVGDRIAVFDSNSPLEGAHDEVCVTAVNTEVFESDSGVSDSVEIAFGECGGEGGTALLTREYVASPLVFDTQDGVLTYNFNVGQGASVGVVGPAGATPGDFYDFDFDRLQEPYSDAFVDFAVVSQGSGAVPHLSRVWLEENAKIEVDEDGGVRLTPAGEVGLDGFSVRWFAGFLPTPGQPQTPLKTNHLHLTAAGDNPNFFGLASQGRA